MAQLNLDFNENVLAHHPTGSRYICDPPVMDTDNDVVILASRRFNDDLIAEGFDPAMTDIEYESQGLFTSWRKGEDNYIVTHNPEFYRKFVLATEEAKKLNLLTRPARVELFSKVLYARA